MNGLDFRMVGLSIVFKEGVTTMGIDTAKPLQEDSLDVVYLLRKVVSVLIGAILFSCLKIRRLKKRKKKKKKIRSMLSSSCRAHFMLLSSQPSPTILVAIC